MTIKVIVNGANGKMGTAAVAAINSDNALTLVAQTGRTDDLAQVIKDTHADVVVDLTSAESAFENTVTILKSGARPVIGTSGLNKTDVTKLQALTQECQLGGIIAPNFSIGAVLLMQHSAQIAKYFPHVEIIEYHHNQKKDAPSGTATRTAEIIANAQGEVSRQDATTLETAKGARGGKVSDIPIHAVRLPGLVAHQAVIFGDTGETLTLRHDSINRDCFMPGILLCCKKVVDADSMIYGLEHLL